MPYCIHKWSSPCTVSDVHLNKKAMYLFLPTYCSTVAPCEGKETHDYYGCSAVHYKSFFSFLSALPWTSSALLTFFDISFNWYLNIWYELCCWFSTFIYCVIKATAFCMFHPVQPHGGVSLSSPWIYQPLMRWAHFSKGVHICILAYLWLPLRHVGECYIANRKF